MSSGAKASAMSPIRPRLALRSEASTSSGMTSGSSSFSENLKSSTLPISVLARSKTFMPTCTSRGSVCIFPLHGLAVEPPSMESKRADPPGCSGPGDKSFGLGLGLCRCDRRLQHGFDGMGIKRADDLLPDDALGIDDEGFRHPIDAPVDRRTS